MNEIQIMAMKPDEVETAALLCAGAFLPTPFSRAIMGGGGEKEKKNLIRGMRSLISSKFGTVLVAKDGERVVGVMRMIEWPDCQQPIFTKGGYIMGRIFAGKAVARVKESRRVWGEHDPKTPHLHIDPICVLPEMQGKGVGSTLMKYYCVHLDKLGMPGYLETDQPINVKFYKKHGFVVKEEGMNIGMPNWYLWREAKRID